MNVPAKPPESWLRWFLWSAICTLLLGQANAAVRALILASDYREAKDSGLRLANTLVDARAVNELFRRLRLQDVRLVENPTAESWEREIDALAGRLTADDVAVLYYAGHAVQVGGSNYFLAADGSSLILSEHVLSAVIPKARGTVFLIDACRNNPFKAQAAESTRDVKISVVGPAQGRKIETLSLAELAGASSGLSQMSNLRGKNTIVLFSTDPGNVALDGDPGRGSPFANAVVRELGKRQSLDAAIRRITADVDEVTRSKQAPWRQGDLTFPLFLAGQPRFPVP
jgi:uncharacterized caspase-like protein